MAFESTWTLGRPVVDCPRIALTDARGLRVAATTEADDAFGVAMAVTAAEVCAAAAGIAGMARQADMTATTTAIRVRINIPVSRGGEEQPTCS